MSDTMAIRIGPKDRSRPRLRAKENRDATVRKPRPNAGEGTSTPPRETRVGAPAPPPHRAKHASGTPAPAPQSHETTANAVPKPAPEQIPHLLAALEVRNDTSQARPALLVRSIRPRCDGRLGAKSLVVAVKEIQSCLVHLRTHSNLLAELQGLVGRRIVCRPLGKPGAIRVAGLGEVHPVTGYDVRELVIGIFPGERPEEVAEDVRNLSGVESAEPFALRAGRPVGEVVEIRRVMAGFRCQPRPGAH